MMEYCDFFFLLIFCCLLLPRWSSLPSRNGGGYFLVRVYWFGIILLEFSQDEFIRFISGGDFLLEFYIDFQSKMNFAFDCIRAASRETIT